MGRQSVRHSSQALTSRSNQQLDFNYEHNLEILKRTYLLVPVDESGVGDTNMITKDESPPVSLQVLFSTKHDFDIFEGQLSITTSELQSFATETCVSIENIYRCVWILHRYTYGAPSLVNFVELNLDFQFVAEPSYLVDESQTLSKICSDLTLSGHDGPEIGRDADEPILLLSSRGQCSNGSKISRPTMDWDRISPIAVVTCLDGLVRLAFLFDKGRVDERMIVSYWYTFEKIFECVVQDSQTVLCKANFLSNHDRNQIIAWNTPVPKEPQDQTICSRINEHVLNRPNAPAVYAWNGTMTYAELDEAACGMSFGLQSLGIGPGKIVPFCIEKSKWALVAAFAVLKAGAALAPMDPGWPTQRKLTILEITEADIVICSHETRVQFDEIPIRVFMVSTDDTVAQKSNTLQTTSPSCQDIAFILFSSGSTGVPKGMIREHGTACVGSFAHAKAMHIDMNSRVLQFANHVFDVAMLDFFTTLIVGGCVCIPSEFDRKNNLAGFIRESQANWVLLTPTVAGMLDPVTVPSLRDLALGGEAVTADLLERWLPYCRVGINYGSAEVDVTHTRDIVDSRDPANLGKRLESCVCYVVDPSNANKILPIGVTGELLVSAPTMARAYLKQPEKTTASFITAPTTWYHTGVDGTKRPWLYRAYKMGDLVQQQWDGSFRFVGRRDFQVKIHGQKVELGEVESQLATHQAVRLCAVIYPRSGPFSERLVAIVDLRGSELLSKGSWKALGLEDIKRHLSQRVPSYMVPQVCVVVDPMPLTATLKIDRQKLMRWLIDEEPIKTSDHALTSISTRLQGPKLLPNEEMELKVSTIIANIVTNELSHDWNTIHGHENSFFEIGLDSVQIMRLSHMITRTFAVKIPVEALTHPSMTVRRLGALIAGTLNADGDVPPKRMTVATLRKTLALLMSQVHDDTRNAHLAVSQGCWSPVSNLNSQPCNLLLTGATGYLGIQILRTVLEASQITTVHIVVRGTDVTRSRARLIKAAEVANWSIEPHLDRVKIWQGDLSRPQLGLDEFCWKQLTHGEQHEGGINCFIHCGAVVDWTKSYHDLEAVNVMSTVQLLNANLRKQYRTRFLYISGGQYFQPGINDSLDEIDQIFEDAASSTGYAQTKLLSEQIVDLIRQRYVSCAEPLLTIQTVKPAYLIGTAQDGVASVNDYLWRVVSAALRQKCYNADEDEQWLFVADVGSVARVIVELAGCEGPSVAGSSGTVKILDGIRVRDFWLIVQAVTGCALQGVSGCAWLADVKTSMELDPKHVLWPLFEIVERRSGLLTNGRCSAEEFQFNTTLVANAVRRNVEHLAAIGFLVATTPA